MVNKTRKSSYLTRSQQIGNSISDGDDMFSFSASNWLEAKMASKTDIVTGQVGQLAAQDVAGKHKIQLRPIMLLNKEHSPKLVGLVGKPPAGDRKARLLASQFKRVASYNNALATKYLVDAPEQSTSCRVPTAMNQRGAARRSSDIYCRRGF